MEDEKQKMLQKLLEMKKELARKQKKLEKAKRAARVKAHVRKKIREHEEMESISNSSCEREMITPNNRNSSPVSMVSQSHQVFKSGESFATKNQSQAIVLDREVKPVCTLASSVDSQFMDVSSKNMYMSSAGLTKDSCPAAADHATVSTPAAVKKPCESSTPADPYNKTSPIHTSHNKTAYNCMESCINHAQRIPYNEVLPSIEQHGQTSRVNSHKDISFPEAGSKLIENSGNSSENAPNDSLKKHDSSLTESEEHPSGRGVTQKRSAHSWKSLPKKVTHVKTDTNTLAKATSGKMKEGKRDKEVPLQEKIQTNVDKNNTWIDLKDFKANQTAFRSMPKVDAAARENALKHQDQNGWLSAARMKSLINDGLSYEARYSKHKSSKESHAPSPKRKRSSKKPINTDLKEDKDGPLHSKDAEQEQHNKHALASFSSNTTVQEGKDSRLTSDVQVSSALASASSCETSHTEGGSKEVSTSYKSCVATLTPDAVSRTSRINPELEKKDGALEGKNETSSLHYKHTINTADVLHKSLQSSKRTGSESDEDIIKASQMDFLKPVLSISKTKRKESILQPQISQESLELTPSFRTPKCSASENKRAGQVILFEKDVAVTDSEFLDILGITDDTKRKHGLGHEKPRDDFSQTEAVLRKTDQHRNKANEMLKRDNTLNPMCKEESSFSEGAGSCLEDSVKDSHSAKKTCETDCKPCAVSDTCLPSSQASSEFSDYTELDSIPFSQFELSEDFLSDACQSQSGVKSVGPLVKRRSRRISVSNPHFNGSSLLQAGSSSSAHQLLSKFSKGRRQSQMQQRKAAAILSVFQFLKDKAQESDSVCHFDLTSDFDDLKLERLRDVNKNFDSQTSNMSATTSKNDSSSPFHRECKDSPSSCSLLSPVRSCSDPMSMGVGDEDNQSAHCVQDLDLNIPIQGESNEKEMKQPQPDSNQCSEHGTMTPTVINLDSRSAHGCLKNTVAESEFVSESTTGYQPTEKGTSKNTPTDLSCQFKEGGCCSQGKHGEDISVKLRDCNDSVESKVIRTNPTNDYHCSEMQEHEGTKVAEIIEPPDTVIGTRYENKALGEAMASVHSLDQFVPDSEQLNDDSEYVNEDNKAISCEVLCVDGNAVKKTPLMAKSEATKGKLCLTTNCLLPHSEDHTMEDKPSVLPEKCSSADTQVSKTNVKKMKEKQGTTDNRKPTQNSVNTHPTLIKDACRKKEMLGLTDGDALSPDVLKIRRNIASPVSSVHDDFASPSNTPHALLSPVTPTLGKSSPAGLRFLSRKSISFTSTPKPRKIAKTSGLSFDSPVSRRGASFVNTELVVSSSFDDSHCVLTPVCDKSLSALFSPDVEKDGNPTKETKENNRSVDPQPPSCHELTDSSLVPECDTSYPSPGQIPVSEMNFTIQPTEAEGTSINTSRLLLVESVNTSASILPWRKLPRTVTTPVQVCEAETSTCEQTSFSFTANTPRARASSQNKTDFKFCGCFQCDSQDAVVSVLCGSVRGPPDADRSLQAYIVSVQATSLTVWGKDPTLGWTTELHWKLNPDTHILKACLVPGSARVAVLVTGWMGSSPLASVLTYEWDTEMTSRFNIPLTDLPSKLSSVTLVEPCPAGETEVYLGVSSEEHHSVLRATLTTDQTSLASFALFQACRGRMLGLVLLQGQDQALLSLSGDQRVIIWNKTLEVALKTVNIPATIPCLVGLLSARACKGVVLMDTLWRVDEGNSGGLIVLNPINGRMVVLHAYPAPNNSWRRVESCKKEGSYITAVSDRGALCVWDGRTGAVLGSVRSNITTCAAITAASPGLAPSDLLVGEIHGCLHIYSSTYSCTA